MLDLLCVRLQLQHYRAHHPAVAAQAIQRPVFILGLPRTGTTILYELMAQDDRFRSPASWEVARPLPPPTERSHIADPRIARVDRAFNLLEQLAPGFRAIHAIGARLSEEIATGMYNYGQLQVVFDDGSIGWYEAGWGPMMSEEAYFVKDVVGPRGCVSIVGVEKTASGSDEIDAHTRTNRLRLHHAALDGAGRFVAAAISSMLSEEVLEASTACAGQAWSRDRNISCLRCICSGIASIARSALRAATATS